MLALQGTTDAEKWRHKGVAGEKVRMRVEFRCVLISLPVSNERAWTIGVRLLL